MLSRINFWLLLLVVTMPDRAMEQNQVAIDDIREASEKIKLIIENARRKMELSVPLLVQAATITNAGGLREKNTGNIFIDEDNLVKREGEDGLIYAAYHEVGHIKDDIQVSSQIINTFAEWSTPLCLSASSGFAVLPLLRRYIPISKNIDWRLSSVLAIGVAMGSYPLGKYVQKKADERKEIAADYYACKALLEDNNLKPIATKLVISKQHELLGLSIHHHNPFLEFRSIEQLLEKAGYTLSVDSSNVFTQEKRKMLTLALHKNNEEVCRSKLSWG